MTKLIAECCQNHNGSREILKRMVHEAADAGADYVKIQGLYSQELSFRERFESGATDADGTVRTIKRPYAAEKDRLQKLGLSVEDEQWFVDECRRAGVASMITVFTRTGLRRVRDMGFEAVKVASYDCASYPLLRELKQVWSTIVVSTGATHDREVERAAEELAGTEFSFLHCVTIYPTPMEELHLRRMDYLRRFTPRVGFSDHTLTARDGLWASKLALAFGASLIERHYTVLGPAETRDGPVSISPAQFSELRQFADRPRAERMAMLRRDYPAWEASVGVMFRELTEQELLNRDYYAGRVTSEIAGRAVFNWEDVQPET